jgi:hypothetical protein
MLDLNFLNEFSRSHCLAICALLVPANLLITSQTILFTVLQISALQIFTVTTAAIIYAMLMVMHVFSWYAIGVIMAPTFILLFLGITCLAINCTAIWLKLKYPHLNYLLLIKHLVIKLKAIFKTIFKFDLELT